MGAGGFFLLLLLVTSAVAVAAADEMSEPPSSPAEVLAAVVPPDSDEETARLLRFATDPSAAEALPHTDLDRGEALTLLEEVYEPVLDGPEPAFDDLDALRYYSDHAALLAPSAPIGGEEQSEPTLLESWLPLRAEDQEGEHAPVDLSLERIDDEIRSSNPLVEALLPTEIQEGVAFPESDIEVELLGAPVGRAASLVEDDAAFYPNVAPDSDLTIVPTPTGIETFTQLRSPDAPTTQSFHLLLPAGAELSAAGDGGAEVRDGDELLLKILPPSAIDATGVAMPVTLSVSGSSIHLSVQSADDAAYPILLDPVYESYAWVPTGASGGVADWVSSTNTSLMVPSGVTGGQYPGLQIQSYAGATAVQFPEASWNYYVPRYFTDWTGEHKARPTSFIKSMSLSGVYWIIDEPKPYAFNPMIGFGIWDEAKNAYLESGWRSGLNGQLTESPNFVYSFPNTNDVTNVKRGTIVTAGAEYKSRSRWLRIGQASVELGDTEDPVLQNVEGPALWMDTSAVGPIRYTAKDSGLGVLEVEAKLPKRAGGFATQVVGMSCQGTVSKPCPYSLRSEEKPITYDPATMPQGETYVPLVARDALGRSVVGEPLLGIDHTNPSLALTGTATEQATLGTKLPSYTLKYAAADGDSATPEALSPFGSAGTAEGKLERPQGVAVDSNGNVWVSDKTNHRIVEFDKNGNFVRQIGIVGTAAGQIKEPRGIAIGANDSVWVAESAPNRRVQQFSSTGQYIRKLQNPPAESAFNEPWGVAVGAGGTIWVTDQASNKINRFKEDGTFLGQISQASLDAAGVSLSTPAGLAVDAFGNAWVAVQGSHKIFEFDSSGKYVFSFGGEGTGNGQLKNPYGVAVASSGNILVADDLNNRIQEFKPDGSYLRQFGTAGTASNQLKEPRGVAVGPGNTAVVAEAGNKRVARWAHADKDPQSGVASVQVKLDGQVVKSESPGCATKNCQISKEWTLNTDNYAVGTHNLEVIATDGVGLPVKVVLPIETHGDLAAPTIAPFTGTLTEQATLGKELPSYTIKASATDPGSAQERQSGVASVELKVDGKFVGSSAPGCPAGGCSLSKEWTLQSSSYTAGTHYATVYATDAAGRTSNRLLVFNIAKDEKAPTITGNNAFYNAPEGWLEQKTYLNNATAADAGGYGITSIALKIDGQTVKSNSQSCPSGSCSLALGALSTINMTAYDGGAHPAELIATDGAGNTTKKSWTINVDPKGEVSLNEAEETLEAVAETSEVNLLGETEAEPAYEGTAEGLELTEADEYLETEGAAAPSYVAADPADGMIVEVPPADAVVPTCPGGSEAGELSGMEEAELAQDPENEVCTVPTADEVEPALEAIEIVPVDVAAGASESSLAGEGATAVSANLIPHVDVVTRPLFDGTMTFAAIRDQAAPEVYEWEITLGPKQELVSIDPQHAQVQYDEEHVAFAVTATPAHDAIGTAVPTTLAVQGNVVSLAIPHKAQSPVGGSFVYPVLGGAGWEGGWEQVQIEMPPNEPSQPGGEEEEGGGVGNIEGVPFVRLMTVGAPEFEGLIGDEANPGGEVEARKKFKFTFCMPHNYPNDPFDGEVPIDWGNVRGGKRPWGGVRF